MAWPPGIRGFRVAVAAALVSTSCAGGSASEELADPPPRRNEPLGAYAEFAAADEAALASAIDHLFRACMLKAGFEIPHFPERSSAEDRANPFRFTSEHAAASGYGFGEPNEVENLQTWFTSLDKATQQVFFDAAFGPEPSGTLPVIDAVNPGAVREVIPPRLGCDGEATNAVMGDYASYESVRLQLQAAYNRAVEQTLTDPRFVDETMAWSRCMGNAGFDYLDPSQARTSAYDLAGRDQQRIAELDAACRESSGYNEAGTQLMRSHQQEWVDSNPGVIEEYETLRAAAISRAEGALAAASNP